jgi:hypothetical protein
MRDWSDKEGTTSEEDNEEGGTVNLKEASKKEVGPIPRFSRIYEVKVCPDTKVFACSCCNQERMGMPCRHIAAVCLDNETILGENSKGFPLSSVQIFWWNQYYLYGLSNRKDHKKSKQALIALASNDTPGLPCPGRLDIPTIFSPSERVFQAYSQPATDRLLNYSSPVAIGAVQKLRDRNNPVRLAENVPAGLSQLSFLPDQDESEFEANDWSNPMEELSDTEDYRDSRQVLSCHYNELSEAFNNSKEKDSLEDEFKTIMNDYIVRARTTAAIPFSSKGQRISMVPASSKRKKTHSTQHY